MSDNSSLVKLEDFITETLTQIIRGVKNANVIAKEYGAIINPATAHRNSQGDLQVSSSQILTRPVQEIDFDIAITAAEKSDTKGGAGVFISIVGIGTQLRDSTENSTVSRIKFRVPIKLPTGKVETK
jgi:hypothetical protein